MTPNDKFVMMVDPKKLKEAIDKRIEHLERAYSDSFYDIQKLKFIRDNLNIGSLITLNMNDINVIFKEY